MRIAFVSDSIYPYNKGGKEKRLHEISKRLSLLGHDVTIYTMHWWKSPDKQIEEHGVKLQAITKNHTMYHSDRRSIKEALLFSLACFKLIRADFDVLDVDHMPYFPIFSTWLVCKLKNKKLNGTWHEALKRSEWVSYMGLPGYIAAFIERISIRLPHTITACSDHTLQLIKSELKRTKRIELVPSGIDVKAMKKVLPNDTKCDVLFVGRLVKDKNVSLLIRSLGLLRDRGRDFRCTIVGTGVEEINILKLIKKHHLEEKVELLGNLPTSENVYSLMKSAKVLVLPSKREGFGIVALEALACGTPVITTNLPANATKGFIYEGLNGSIVHATQTDLADKIEIWLDKLPEHENISNQVATYDWKKLAGKQAEVYST